MQDIDVLMRVIEVPINQLNHLSHTRTDTDLRKQVTRRQSGHTANLCLPATLLPSISAQRTHVIDRYWNHPDLVCRARGAIYR